MVPVDLFGIVFAADFDGAVFAPHEAFANRPAAPLPAGRCLARWVNLP